MASYKLTARAATKQIWRTLMRATSEGTVPFGTYGPTTCRWATREEMKQLALTECPLVHLDTNGEIDCYFTPSRAGHRLARISQTHWECVI